MEGDEVVICGHGIIMAIVYCGDLMSGSSNDETPTNCKPGVSKG